jgi:citronellol/citronellal dehydrogenase
LAIQNPLGGDAIMRMPRSTDNIADAAALIFANPTATFTGNFLIDDMFLAREGITDFDRYRIDPSQPLAPDFFVPDDATRPAGVSVGGRQTASPS